MYIVKQNIYKSSRKNYHVGDELDVRHKEKTQRADAQPFSSLGTLVVGTGKRSGMLRVLAVRKRRERGQGGSESQSVYVDGNQTEIGRYVREVTPRDEQTLVELNAHIEDAQRRLDQLMEERKQFKADAFKRAKTVSLRRLLTIADDNPLAI